MYIQSRWRKTSGWTVCGVRKIGGWPVYWLIEAISLVTWDFLTRLPASTQTCGTASR